MRNKMTKIGAVLVTMLLLVSTLFASAFADGWEGELTVKPQNGLGDAKDELKDALDDLELSLIVGADKTAVSIDGNAIDLGEDCHSVLSILMNLSAETAAISNEMESKAGFTTADVKPEENIYSSLFTESRFRKLSSEELADILSCRGLRDVLGGIADWDQLTAADDFAGNITFFQAEGKYLIMLDFTAGGNDYLLNAENDGYSVSVSVFTDTGVTDWDDTKQNILGSKSASGRGINVFAMVFDEKTEVENYVEIAKYSGQESTRLELTHNQSATAGEECDLEIVAVRNEEKCMKIQSTLEAAETDLSSAVSMESAAGSVDPSAYEVLKKCMQVIFGE